MYSNARIPLIRFQFQRKKKKKKRKASTNQIQKAPKKAKTTTTTMATIFLLFSKGRFPFTSSRCQRVVRTGAGGRPRWSITTTTMTTSSPRPWARWRKVGGGQTLESRKLLFLLTVKVLIRVQEGSSVFLFLSSNHNGAAKFALYALHCTSLPQMSPYFSANCQLDTHTEQWSVGHKHWKGNGSKKQSHHQWKTSNQLSTSLISLFFQASQIFQTISVFDNIEKQYVKLLT